jgi:hypothetical protein
VLTFAPPPPTATGFTTFPHVPSWGGGQRFDVAVDGSVHVTIDETGAPKWVGIVGHRILKSGLCSAGRHSEGWVLDREVVPEELAPYVDAARIEGPRRLRAHLEDLLAKVVDPS